jgi:heptosyltransferase III
MGLNPRLSRISASSYKMVTKILIIRACAIGDFVLNFPALRALYRHYPNARFTLVGNVAPLELAREIVPVENIYSIELRPWSRLFYEAIPELEFDSAIVWMRDPTVAENLRFSRIPSVVRADPFPSYGHAADHLLRTLKLDKPELPDLWAPRLDEVIIHAGSGGSKKIWPHFEELIECLPEAVVLRESANSRSPAEERALNVPILENLMLTEVGRRLCSCRAYIGNDSGITHLAAYLGCPTIALFGPTDPRVWGPVGRRARVIWKSKLEEITVDEVLNSLHAANARTRING